MIFKKNFNYKPSYDNPLIRGDEESRPWDIVALVKSFGSPEKSLLDIGCGAGTKLVKIAPSFGYVMGMDPEIPLLEVAQKKMQEHHIHHFHSAQGSASELPFNNESFDVITSIVAVHDVRQIYRVLKPGGYAIIESMGEMDKRQFVSYFLDEHHKPRGNLSYLPEGAVRDLNYMTFRYLFDEVSVREGFWKSYSSYEGIVALLNDTPTIRHFDMALDQEAVNKAVYGLMTDRGIELIHHRVLTIVKKGV